MTPSDADLEKAREIADNWFVLGDDPDPDEIESKQYMTDEIATAIAEARASENEACAKVADEYARTAGQWDGTTQRAARKIAAAIRSRKESQ